MNDFQEPGVQRARRPGRMQRLVLAVAVAGTVLIALGAFWLSFTSLAGLARQCGIPADRAWVWPLIVDGVIVVATVAVVAVSGGGWDRRAARYPWALLLAGACVSVLANASHALVAVHARVPTALAALVAAVPPLVLLAITHLTVELTGRRTPIIAATATAQTPPTPRRRPGRANPADARRPVGEALRLRAQTSLSNREIARRLGVHPSTVGRWLQSERAVTVAGPTPAAPHAHGQRRAAEQEISKERSAE